MSHLMLSPLQIGDMTLKNRVVFPSMCNFYCDPNGDVNDRLKAYVAARMKGGAAAMVMPGSPHGEPSPARPALSDDCYMDGWRELADICHREGGKLIVQLHPATHQAGRSTKNILPSELTVADMERTALSYAQGAKRAKDSGVDAVEIHGAHAHEIAQFLSPKYNNRTDAYGGSVAGFAKFPCEIVAKIKALCGDSYPVLFKISSDEMVDGGRHVDQTIELLPYLVDAGVDGFTVSIGMAASEEYISGPMDLPQGYNLGDIAKIKQATTVPVMALNRILSHEMGEEILATGQADLLGVGRAMLADPDWVNKVTAGVPLRQCIGCNQACRASVASKEIQCTQNPQVGLEYVARTDLNWLAKKKVLIVGAGVAGLETAVRLCEAGTRPVIIEQCSTAGGLVTIAALPPHKEAIRPVVDYRLAMLNDYGVEIRYNCPLTQAVLDEVAPDMIFLATGSVPKAIDPALFQGAHLYTPDQVLAMGGNIGKRVAVVGGGLVGCETAEYLAAQGAQVEVFGRRDTILGGLAKNRRAFMTRSLAALGVVVHTKTQVEQGQVPILQVTEDGVAKSYDDFDAIVVATGRTPVNPLAGLQLPPSAPVYMVGDCHQMGLLQEAITHAYRTVEGLQPF